MSVTIPCRTDLPHYTMQVALDEPVTLEFRWNDREQAWYLSVLSEDESEVIAQDVKVVLDWPICYRSTAWRSRFGMFNAVDTSGLGKAPGVAELGDRVQLVYFSRAELAALAE